MRGPTLKLDLCRKTETFCLLEDCDVNAIQDNNDDDDDDNDDDNNNNNNNNNNFNNKNNNNNNNNNTLFKTEEDMNT